MQAPQPGGPSAKRWLCFVCQCVHCGTIPRVFLASLFVAFGRTCFPQTLCVQATRSQGFNRPAVQKSFANIGVQVLLTLQLLPALQLVPLAAVLPVDLLRWLVVGGLGSSHKYCLEDRNQQ